MWCVSLSSQNLLQFISTFLKMIGICYLLKYCVKMGIFSQSNPINSTLFVSQKQKNFPLKKYAFTSKVNRPKFVTFFSFVHKRKKNVRFKANLIIIKKFSSAFSPSWLNVLDLFKKKKYPLVFCVTEKWIFSTFFTQLDQGQLNVT